MNKPSVSRRFRNGVVIATLANLITFMACYALLWIVQAVTR